MRGSAADRTSALAATVQPLDSAKVAFAAFAGCLPTGAVGGCRMFASSEAQDLVTARFMLSSRLEAAPAAAQRPGSRKGGPKSSEEKVMPRRALVSVVDDDESVRESLPDFLRSFGYNVEPFASAEEFLASDSLERTGCLVLDVAMPGMSGPELQLEMARRRIAIPIVFITAHSAPRVASQVLSRGAVACLLKPFTDAAILDAVNSAMGKP